MMTFSSAVLCLLLGVVLLEVQAAPLHAQCKVSWKFGTSCEAVAASLQKQMDKWSSEDNCKNGGEKCLYKFASYSDNVLKATHETPKKHYVDDLTFTFKKSTANSCECEGYSTSETWYAVLDYGTNYCNLRNIIDGAGLSTLPNFSETTSDSICTQYSSRDCEKY